MNGIELSEQYYNECGKAIFESRFKSLMARVAIGLVGPGSECLGFDDEYSRDHDWGPGFCLWLTQKDFQQYGQQFHDCYNQLPRSFKNFAPRQVSQGESNRVGPMTISDFFFRHAGLKQIPQTLSQWDIPSSNLSLCTNGKVFSDPLGEFTLWRKSLLNFYPEDLRLKKIADCCMHAGQSGQYNWQRGILRKDSFVTTLAKTTFCTQIINLVYLLNKTYAPYFKWMLKGVKELPILGTELAKLIEKILIVNGELMFKRQNWEAQQETMGKVCKKIIAELQKQDLTDCDATFLIDHVPSILDHISDSTFKNQLWGGK